MHPAPALVACVLALKASAFLLPLEVSEAARRANLELNPPAGVLMIGGSVDLDCPSCPFFNPETPTEPQPDIENKIHFEFVIDSEDRLTINDFPIYPHDFNGADSSPVLVTTRQVRIEDGQESDPIPVEFALEALEPIKSIRGPAATLQPIRFTVLGLQGRPVKVDTIVIDLLQEPERTGITRFVQIPFEQTPGATTCDTSSKWSLCRLRAIVAARLQLIMASAKARAQRSHGWMKNAKGCHGSKIGSIGTNHGHGHHLGGWHRHHGFHRFGHILHQTLRFFIIPALLGIIGGLMASAIGMLVGQTIVYLWIRFHRRGQQGNASSRVVEVGMNDDEKDPLRTEDLPPPPPRYQDLEAGTEEVEIASDEKH